MMGSLLALHKFNPNPTGSETIYTTTSTTLVPVDATNMAVTFTAPASGSVIVRATVHWIPSQNGQKKGGIVHGAMLEGSTVVCGPNLMCRDVTGNGYTNPFTWTTSWLVADLEPDSVHTFALGYCADLTTGTQVGVAVGGTGLGTNSGAALFEVWDAGI